MAVKGIDIAWARPTIAEIKGTGATWVARYFSTDSTKNITADEVKTYPANGLAIVTVWETTTGRATQGQAAGESDAHAADAQRAAVGLPADAPIHFAVDEDTDWASVAAYFSGVAQVLGLHRVGIYGGLKVIAGAHTVGIPYLWQTVAWSGGIWAPYATIRQTAGTELSGGADDDYAEVPDFGQYPRPNGSNNGGGTDVSLTAENVWAYKGPGDSPDVHQTVQNLTAQSKSNGAGISALKLELDQVKAALAGLTEVKLTDAQVAALADQIVPVLVPKLVAALGHALDGTKP